MTALVVAAAISPHAIHWTSQSLGKRNIVNGPLRDISGDMPKGSPAHMAPISPPPFSQYHTPRSPVFRHAAFHLACRPCCSDHTLNTLHTHSHSSPMPPVCPSQPPSQKEKPCEHLFWFPLIIFSLPKHVDSSSPPRPLLEMVLSPAAAVSTRAHSAYFVLRVKHFQLHESPSHRPTVRAIDPPRRSLSAVPRLNAPTAPGRQRASITTVVSN